VIAPDLPGIGDSDIPTDGLDMKSACDSDACASELVGRQESGSRRSRHRIDGRLRLRPRSFPSEVTKLVVMMRSCPESAVWEAVYNDSHIWHFRFNGPTPEALVNGRERTYFTYFWNDLAADKTRSLPQADREPT